MHTRKNTNNFESNNTPPPHRQTHTTRIIYMYCTFMCCAPALTRCQKRQGSDAGGNHTATESTALGHNLIIACPLEEALLVFVLFFFLFYSSCWCWCWCTTSSMKNKPGILLLLYESSDDRQPKNPNPTLTKRKTKIRRPSSSTSPLALVTAHPHQ